MDDDGEDFQDSSEVDLSDVYFGIIRQYMFLREWDRDNELLDYAIPNEDLCRIYDGLQPKSQARMEFSTEEFLRNERLWSSQDTLSRRREIYIEEYSFQLEDEGAAKMFFEGIKYLDSFAKYLKKQKPQSQFLLPLQFNEEGTVENVDIGKAMELLEMTSVDKVVIKPNSEEFTHIFLMDFLSFQENVFFNFYREMQKECIDLERTRGEESSKLVSILSQVANKKSD